MPAFAKDEQGSYQVIPRSVAVIKGLIAQPMGQGVEAESLLSSQGSAQSEIREKGPADC
jgi:hypothetical protein